eukprot:COSAG02_NODE_12_length_58022_cov_242.077379_2_plen_224_part_00
MDEKRSLVLPRSPSVDAVLDNFVSDRRNSTGDGAVAAEQFARRIRIELRNTLGTKLLYSAERRKYQVLTQQTQAATQTGQSVGTAGTAASSMDVLIGKTYGAQHLLRLLVAVPSLRFVPAADDLGQSKRLGEVEHFIQFLAKHTGVSEWLGDAAAYEVPRETQISDHDNGTKSTEAMRDATEYTSITVSPPKAGVTASGQKCGKGVDWRERALSFLDSVDGDL